MSYGKAFMQALGLLLLLAVAACPISVNIAVTKLPSQTGGKYAISGKGFAGNELVRLEIQNVPLKQPSMWQLGTASTVNGSFSSFETEEFRCIYVKEQQQRDQLKSQQIRFVATGVTSNYSASAVDTAGGIIICP